MNRLILRAKELDIINSDIEIIGVAKPEKGNKTIGNIEQNGIDCVYYMMF